MSDTEIRGKLTIDDASTGALEKIAGSLDLVEHKVRHVGGELAGMARQAAATAIGFQFDRGIHSLMELGHEAIEAAKGLGAEEKALTGVLMMTDRTGASYEKIKGQASELHEELENLGVASGVATGTITEMFGDIAARSQKSADEVKELVGQLVNVGKVAPGGAEALAGGFSMLEMGIARARNPVVQFIAQTNVLSDQMHKAHMNAREVAKEMSRMTPQSQIELAEAAIARMNERVKDVPLNFAQLMTSMKNMREQVFEKIGVPILRGALTPALKEVQQYMSQHRAEVEEFAANVGKTAGEWIKSGIAELKDGFTWVRAHATEIKDAIVTAAHAIKEAVAFVVQHKETFAVMFGAKAMLPMLGGLTGGITGALSGIQGAYGNRIGAMSASRFAARESAFQEATAGKEQAFQKLAAGLASLQAGGSRDAANREIAAAMQVIQQEQKSISTRITAWDKVKVGAGLVGEQVGQQVLPGVAMAAVAMAIDQAVKLAREGGLRSERSKDAEAMVTYFNKMATEVSRIDPNTFSGMADHFVKLADAIGMTAREAREYTDSIWRQHNANLELERVSEGYLDSIARAAALGITTKEQFVGPMREGTEEPEQTPLTNWAAYYNQGAKEHNEALQAYAANVLAGSDALQTALMSGSLQIEGGFEHLADLVKDKSENLSKILRGMAGEHAEAKSHPLQLHFNGGQTFHIKQDFRDATPDRVMLMFKRDIARAAMFRTQSRLSSPFGI